MPAPAGRYSRTLISYPLMYTSQFGPGVFSESYSCRNGDVVIQLHKINILFIFMVISIFLVPHGAPVLDNALRSCSKPNAKLKGSLFVYGSAINLLHVRYEDIFFMNGL